MDNIFLSAVAEQCCIAMLWDAYKLKALNITVPFIYKRCVSKPSVTFLGGLKKGNLLTGDNFFSNE